MIRGPSGAGKSDLALRLVDSGATLVADDYCDLTATEDRLIATAPATIAGKIEVRGFGIVEMAHLPQTHVRLIVDLTTAEIERMPETPWDTLAGVRLPRLTLDPRHAAAAAKVRLVVQSLTDR